MKLRETIGDFEEPQSSIPETTTRGCSPVSFPSIDLTETSSNRSDTTYASVGSPGDFGSTTWRLPALRSLSDTSSPHRGKRRRKHKDKPFDKRTIYDNSDRVLDNLTDMRTKELNPDIVPRLTHCQEHSERKLIEKWRKTLRSPTRIGFAAQVMKNYKDPVSEEEPSYRTPVRSPRHPYGQKAKSMDEVVETLTKYRKGIARPIPRKYHQRTTCVDQNNNASTHFCDVLGPGACSVCIEKTNRKFARDVERTLPIINVDSVGMVAPRLSKLLCSNSRDPTFDSTFNRMCSLTENGDRRKRRLHIYLNVNGTCGVLEE